VSIIQLAAPSRIYLFDYQHLRSHPPFIDFFVQLMEDPRIVKVGHTFSSDLQYLGKNFPKEFSCKAVVDIAKLFKELYPQELYTSLAYLTQKFIGKQLCKYEQRSNWARRPLKKTQLYYAALDADVCLAIYRHLSN
jgi:ribonuclease D